MPSKRLRTRAQRIARAQARPARQAQRGQIQATRHDTKAQVRSLGSEGRAVQSAIGKARHDFLTIPGLKGRDQRIALEQLAAMRGSTAAGIASAQAEARQTGRESITQLRQTMPHPDVASTLADLIAQRTANRHDVKMAKLGSRLDLKSALATAAAQAKADRKTGGLTPNERRGIRQDKSSALSLARSALGDYLKAARKAGKTLPDPGNWSDKRWAHYADSLVSAYPTHITGSLAQFAVHHLKRHYRKKAGPFALRGGGASATVPIG